jgi:polar amino acid transport system substrate-binding protein
MIALSRRAVCRMVPMAITALVAGARPSRAADLKVVFYNAFPPVSFENESHQIVGILPDLMTEILERRMKLPVAMQGMPWARAQASVQDGSADLFCTVPTSARLDYAVFTRRPAIILKIELFYAVDNPRRAEIEAIRTIEQLKGFRQGDYVGDGFAETTFKGMPIDWTPNLESVFKKIELGRADMFVGTEVVAKSIVKQLGLGEKIRSVPVDIGQPMSFCIGVRKTFPEAASMIERADEAIEAAEKDGTLSKIIQRYTS